MYQHDFPRTIWTRNLKIVMQVLLKFTKQQILKHFKLAIEVTIRMQMYTDIV